MEPVVALVEPCPTSSSLADCIEKEALDLALEAKVVVRGLTGLVTEDSDQCLKPLQGDRAEICLDGTSENGYRWEDEYGYGSSDSYGGGAYSGGEIHYSPKLAFFLNFAMSAILLAVSFVV